MNVRLIKETRDQAPVLVGTALLFAVISSIWGDRLGPVCIIVFAISCGIMGAASFGNELQHRTLSLLLSQPISRQVVWREKMLVLGGGMAALVAVLLGCMLIVGRPTLEVLPLVVIPLCAFCGAPCLTLASRSGIVGFVSTAAVPSLVVAGGAAASHFLFHDEVAEDRAALYFGALLIAYCAFIYWRGYATFKKLQVMERAPLELTMPAWLDRLLARPLSGVWAGKSGPFVSLVRKELRLQQPSFLIAGLFCLVAGVGACAFLIPGDWGAAILGGDFGMYLIIIPLIVGAMAVAEERGWGVAEWHLTLPPSGLKQWSAKMLVTLSTSLFLTLLLPLALFLVGWVFLGSPHEGASIPPVYVMLIVLAAQLLVTSVAAYAATFSTSALKAILWAFGIILVGCFLGVLLIVRVVVFAERWAGGIWVSGSAGGQEIDRLVCWLVATGLFLILGLVQLLAWSNFRQAALPVRRYVLQLVALLLLVGLLSAALSTCVALLMLSAR